MSEPVQSQAPAPPAPSPAPQLPPQTTPTGTSDPFSVLLTALQELEKQEPPEPPKGWSTAVVGLDPYGRDFKVLAQTVDYGMAPEDTLLAWHTSWTRDPGADHGEIRPKANLKDGTLSFSVVLKQENKVICEVQHSAFLPSVFTPGGVFDVETRLESVFKDVVLRALWDQLNEHLTLAFPQAPRRKPRMVEPTLDIVPSDG